MKNDILLIYPQDDTTNFLQGIPDFLFERFGKQRFIRHRIGISDTETQECISNIQKAPDDSFIIFLGHGSSQGFMNARIEEHPPKLLIERSNSHILHGKDVFSLSCRSSEFLKNQQIKGIGFGDLITEWGEVINRRESEIGAYRHSKGDIQKADIDHANTHLVNVVRHSLNEAISYNLSLQELHLQLKLRFNQTIFKLINEKKPMQVRWIANLLLEAKNEMKLFL